VIVAECDAVRRQAGKCTLLEIPWNVSRANALKRVGIAHVPAMAIDDEEVLVTIEVDVDERRSPCPVTRCNTSKIGDVDPRTVAA
jgi:hypothetical protein